MKDLPVQIRALGRCGYAHTLGQARNLIRLYWEEKQRILKERNTPQARGGVTPGNRGTI